MYIRDFEGSKRSLESILVKRAESKLFCIVIAEQSQPWLCLCFGLKHRFRESVFSAVFKPSLEIFLISTYCVESALHLNVTEMLCFYGLFLCFGLGFFHVDLLSIFFSKLQVRW